MKNVIQRHSFVDQEQFTDSEYSCGFLDGFEQEQPKMPRKLNQKYDNHLQGKWSREEDEIYIKFILENKDLLVTKNSRRSSKVFKQLSENLNCQRTPEQCRMHHQRMKKKARGRSILAIVKFICKKYNIEENVPFLNVCGLDKQTKKKPLEKTVCLLDENIEVSYEIGNGFCVGIKLLEGNFREW